MPQASRFEALFFLAEVTQHQYAVLIVVAEKPEDMLIPCVGKLRLGAGKGEILLAQLN